MAKYPAFQFYPGDWLKDAGLRRCSPAARGVWIDLICLMFECEERGVLTFGDKPWTDDEIAGAVTGNHDVVLACVHELIDKGVARRREDGALFSRRLVRDEDIRQKRADAGSKGGSKTQAKRKQLPEDEVEDEVKSENSEGRGCKGRGKAEGVPIPPGLDTPEFRTSWAEWLTWRRVEKRKQVTPTAAKKQLKTLSELETPDDAISAIDLAIANDWQGIWPKERGTRSGPGDTRGKAGPESGRTEKRRRDFAEPDAPIPNLLAGTG